MIRLICVGKAKDEFKKLSEEYCKRINSYHKCEVVEIKDESIVDNDSYDNIKDKEALRVLKQIKDDEYVILLDLKGKEYDSISFSSYLEKTINTKTKICFVIAGSLGASGSLKDRANDMWCISKLTFLHQMCRVIVLEQIYRSFKILHNESYHK